MAHKCCPSPKSPIRRAPTEFYPTPLTRCNDRVHMYSGNRYGLRKLIDATCWDLLYNAHSLRKRLLSVEIFARFLEV